MKVVSLLRRLLHGVLLLAGARLFLTHALLEEGSSDWLVLCTADGQLFTVHASTGSVQVDQVVNTDPLIGRSIMPPSVSPSEQSPSNSDQDVRYEDDSDSDDSMDSSNIILPGLDGRLYWQQDDGSLEALQLEISSLLEQPVKSCYDEHEKDCGILTATVETSLLALTSQGKVQWYDKKEQHLQLASLHPDEDFKTELTNYLKQHWHYWHKSYHQSQNL